MADPPELAFYKETKNITSSVSCYPFLYSLIQQSYHLNSTCTQQFTTSVAKYQFLQTTNMANETVITTPLPAEVTPQAVINSLHNHDLYIKTTCPQLISQKHLSGTPGLDSPCVYEITDKRAVGETTFQMTLTSVAEGLDSLIEGKAPTGAMTIKSKWRVVGGELHETVEIDSNIVTKKVIQGNVEKAHPGFHQYAFLNFSSPYRDLNSNLNEQGLPGRCC